MDIIYKKQGDIYNNKSGVNKKTIGAIEFSGIILESDILENELNTEIFATFRNGFILSFTLIYSNKYEKKELYEIVNNIKI